MKMSQIDRVRNEEDQEKQNALHTVNKRKDNWIGHILRSNCLLKRVIEGKMREG
jgi:hypothetical protein